MFQELVELFLAADPLALLFRPEVVRISTASSIEEVPAAALVLIEIVSDELSSAESSFRRQVAYASWLGRQYTSVRLVSSAIVKEYVLRLTLPS